MPLRKKSKNLSFLSPNKKNWLLYGPSRVKLCPSRLRVVSKVFDLLYDQRYAMCRIGYVSDAYLVRVHVSDTQTLHKVTVSVLQRLYCYQIRVFF